MITDKTLTVGEDILEVADNTGTSTWYVVKVVVRMSRQVSTS